MDDDIVGLAFELRSDQKPRIIGALETLTERLLFQLNPSMVNVRIYRSLLAATADLVSTSNPEINASVLQAINMILYKKDDFAPRFFQQIDLLQRIRDVLDSETTVSVAEQAIRIVLFYSSKNPGYVVSSFDISLIFKVLPLLSRVDQRGCLTLMKNIVNYRVDPVWAEFVPNLRELMESDDTKTKVTAVQVFSVLMMHLPCESLSNDYVTKVSELINIETDCDTVIGFLRILIDLCKSLDKRKEVAKCEIDFSRLLRMFETDKNHIEMIVLLIQYLLPPPELSNIFWTIPGVERTDGVQFVEKVEPVLIEIVMKYKDKLRRIALVALAACAQITPVDLPHEMYKILVSLLAHKSCIPFVVALISKTKDKTMLQRSGILSVMKNIHVSHEYKDWVEGVMLELHREVKIVKKDIPKSIIESNDLDEICSYLKKEQMEPFEFWYSDVPSHVISLLSRTDDVKCDISVLVDLANSQLGYYLVKRPRKEDISTMSSELVTFAVKGRGEFTVPFVCDFLSVEGWYNMNFNPGIKKRLMTAMQENRRLMELSDISKQTMKYEDQFASICRACNVKDYWRCSFKLGNKIFSAFDKIASAVVMKKSKAKKHKVVIEVIMKEARRSTFDLHTLRAESFQPLELLKLIAQKAPSQFYLAPDFIDTIFQQFKNAYQTLTMDVPGVKIFATYKEVFPLEKRVFLFKVLSMNSKIGLHKICQEFWPGVHLNLPSMRCTVSRESIFDDGCVLMKQLGPGRFRTQISFQGEPGFGEGPLSEFVSLFSKEFCKRDVKLWRDDFSVDSEYVVHSNGLFPAVTADPNLLEIFGTFCGKALLMDKVLGILLHPSFIKMILGQPVTIAEIDPMLAASLTQKEALYDLPFVYPGTEVELKEGGVDIFTDAENIDEYIALIESFTCGSIMSSKIDYFIRGFETVVHCSVMNLLTCEEIVTMFAGSFERLRMDDLKKYVKVEHGYAPDSRAVTNLFEIIDEMSDEEQALLVKFITGAKSLPVGGLKSLSPPLTIANRFDSSDSSLPSVMTCTNYFKLPDYSSKEIMKQKIITAITECQETFQFS